MKLIYNIFICIAFFLPKGFSSNNSQKQIEDDISACLSKIEKANGVLQYDSMFYYAKKGYVLTIKTPNRTFLPYYYFYASQYCSHYRNYKKAILLAKEGLKNALRTKNYLLYERISYLLALIYSEMGDKKAAINQIFINIRPSTTFSKSPITSAANFQYLANFYFQVNEDSLWAYYIEKAVNLREKYKVKRSPIGKETDAGIQLFLNLYKHNTKATIYYLNKIKKIHKHYKLPNDNYFLNFIAVLNIAVRFNEESLIPVLLTMVDTQEFIDNATPVHLAEYYHHLAAFYVYKKKFKLARFYFNKCIDKRQLLVAITPLVIETEIKILEYEGRYREATILYKEARKIASNQTEKLKEVELATLERRLADDYQDLKLASVQQKVKIEQLENKQKKEQLKSANNKILLISSILVILLIAVVMYWFLVLKLRKQAKSLALLIENKDRLFSMIGHDLRGPIVSILSLSSHSQTNDSNFTENQEKYLKNLLFTVDNILQWSLSQQEKLTPNTIDISIVDIIEEVLEELEAFIHLSYINIKTSCDILNPVVKFDEYHLKIIVRNIVHNAIKYTPSGGNVFISITQTDSITLSIQDTGKGMGGQIQNPNARSTKIGLEIVQKLVSLNKATLRIESKPNEGTLASIVFN
ncbi:sensor histidine kinase [Flectobacillus roseus]|uniref:HAMP domain-containing sensor histidine kinase n=1 Tax=Flectobacillus roseus TaxID=502259 RepID=A0ABT6Y633_9BACT|nr:HAMP domain-containing sensor histidine kinase [Flectobacillus roseus]MDI9858991.1 HAMP domain-containing sensor histidine kinase [Flectobacillus roseus]